MNTQEARYLFAAALNDSLNLPQRVEFEAALKADAALCAEFERYADAQAGDVGNVSAWLEQSGNASRLTATSVDVRVVEELIARVGSKRKRMRIIQVAGAVAGLAAAAAIVAVLLFPAAVNTPPVKEEGVNAALAQVDKQGKAIFTDGTHYAATTSRGQAADGTYIEISAGTVYRMEQRALTILDGQARIKLAQGELDVRAAGVKVHAAAPAEFRVLAQATTLSDNYEESLVQYDKLHGPRKLARFGAASLTLTISVFAGSVAINAQGVEKTVKAGDSYGPVLLQAAPPQPQHPPQGGQPPKPEDAFAHLDANSDGELDETEFGDPGHTDFDDDKDGKVSLAEFKAHFKAHGPSPEDVFKHEDKNNDGALDNTEVDQKLIDESDDNKDGKVSLDEFKAHFKPRQPKPEDEFAKLDKNSDGKLDNTETNQRMVDDFDDDKDGKVSLDEFKAHWRPQGPGPDEEFGRLDRNNDGKLDDVEIDQRMLDDMDKNNDDLVDLDEWRDFHKPENAFARMDKNSDGKLDNTEVDQRLIDDLDKNKDGSVDLDEFKAGGPRPRGPGGPGGPGGQPPQGGGQPPRGPGGPGGGGPGGPGGGGKPPRPPK